MGRLNALLKQETPMLTCAFTDNAFPVLLFACIMDAKSRHQETGVIPKERKERMKIVSVCACTVGIAHTYMAKDAIEKEAKKRGWECKVEAQGGYGTEDELEDDEIAAADAVLLAIAVGITGDDRFDEKRAEGKVITMDPSDVLHDVTAVFNQVAEMCGEPVVETAHQVKFSFSCRKIVYNLRKPGGVFNQNHGETCADVKMLHTSEAPHRLPTGESRQLQPLSMQRRPRRQAVIDVVYRRQRYSLLMAPAANAHVNPTAIILHGKNVPCSNLPFGPAAAAARAAKGSQMGIGFKVIVVLCSAVYAIFGVGIFLRRQARKRLIHAEIQTRVFEAVSQRDHKRVIRVEAEHHFPVLLYRSS